MSIVFCVYRVLVEYCLDKSLLSRDSNYRGMEYNNISLSILFGVWVWIVWCCCCCIKLNLKWEIECLFMCASCCKHTAINIIRIRDNTVFNFSIVFRSSRNWDLSLWDKSFECTYSKKALKIWFNVLVLRFHF